jgi:dienelactone hydrolase
LSAARVLLGYAFRVMRRLTKLLMTAALAMQLCGCVSASTTRAVKFANVTPGAPQQLSAVLVRPAGAGPFPAVVQLHGCGGVEAESYRWARWFADRGYVALIVDSFGPRNLKGDCRTGPDEPPVTARFDDAFGALRYLQSLPFVRPDRIGAIGWSQGGVYAMAVINGPSLERAAKRGVELPPVGFAAAIGVYPGGCFSLVNEGVIRPLLVLIGAADDWTSAAQCEEMVTAMKSRGADASIVIYPGAYHYFDVEGQPLTVLSAVDNEAKPEGHGATVGYQAAAAHDAHRRVDAFLARHLEGAGP